MKEILMGGRLWMGMVLFLWGAGTAFAFDLIPTETATPSMPKPLALTTQEKIRDSIQYPLPRPPHKVDGSAMDLTNEEDMPPQDAALRDLTDNQALQQIPEVNKSDKNSGKYYWHPFKGWNYCHYREGDRQWYGWHTGGAFHWILWRSGHFWWRDNYAQRWLYFDRGYWWWQEPKVSNQFQVFLEDGHYHSCDANGVLADDLMRAGTEEVETAPVAKPSVTTTPGAKHSGHHGGHHMSGGTPGGTGTGMGGD
jgi:hypothetical protein